MRLRIRVEPRRARPTIYFRGRSYRTRRFVSPPLTPNDQPERVTISASGYLVRQLDIVPNKDRTFEIRLKKRRPRPGMRKLYGLE